MGALRWLLAKEPLKSSPKSKIPPSLPTMRYPLKFWPTSTAPMVALQLAPAPRARPHWSAPTPVATHTASGMTPTAGLLSAGSRVWVGPPLLAREPSWGFWPMMSVAAGVPQFVLSIRL